jgi:hypothetical protein
LRLIHRGKSPEGEEEKLQGGNKLDGMGGIETKKYSKLLILIQILNLFRKIINLKKKDLEKKRSKRK